MTKLTARNLSAARVVRGTRRRPLRTIAAFLVLAGALVRAGVAQADVAPPDSCTAPGQPCGSDGCTCRETTCTRVLPCSLCGVTVSCPGVGGRGGRGGSGGNADEDAGLSNGGGHTSSSLCTSVYACDRCRSESGASCVAGSGGSAAGRSGAAGSGGRSEADAGESEEAGASGQGHGQADHHHGCSAVVDDADVPALLALGVVIGLLAGRRKRA